MPHNLSTNTGAPTYVAGKFGQALNAKAGTLVTADSLGSTIGTLEMFFNVASSDATGTYQIMFCAAGSPNVFLALNASNNIDLASNSQNLTYSGPSLADGNDHFVAVTFDPENVTIWLDGVQVAQGAASTYAPSGMELSGPCYVGAFSSDGGFHFPGWIDSLRISSVNRWPTTCTTPTSAFTADGNTTALYQLDGNGNDTGTPATPTLTVSPTSGTVVDGVTTLSMTPTLANSLAGISASLTGAGSISTTSPASGSPVIYTPPTTGSGSATVTFTDSIDSLTASVAISYAPAATLTFGTPLTLVSNVLNAITFSYEEASGGVGTLTYRLCRYSEPFTLGSGNVVASGTGLSLVDTSAPPGDNYYLVEVSDTDGNTASSAQNAYSICYVVGSVTTDVTIMTLGDSTVLGYGSSNIGTKSASYLMPQLIGEEFPTAAVTAVNGGVNGTTSSDWVNSTNGASLSSLLGYKGPGLNFCAIQLGANDIVNGVVTSPTNYRANLASICATLIAADVVPVVYPPFYRTPGATIAESNASPLLLAYRDELISLADDSTIYLGATKSFDVFAPLYQGASASSWTVDGTHPTDQGYALLANIWFPGMARVVGQKLGFWPASSSEGSPATAYTVTFGFTGEPIEAETYTASVTLNNPASASGVITFGAISGVTWGGPVAIASGASSGSTTITFTGSGTLTPTVSHTGLGFSGDPTLSPITVQVGNVTAAQLTTALAALPQVLLDSGSVASSPAPTTTTFTSFSTTLTAKESGAYTGMNCIFQETISLGRVRRMITNHVFTAGSPDRHDLTIAYPDGTVPSVGPSATDTFELG